MQVDYLGGDGTILVERIQEREDNQSRDTIKPASILDNWGLIVQGNTVRIILPVLLCLRSLGG